MRPVYLRILLSFDSSVDDLMKLCRLNVDIVKIIAMIIPFR
jgi:hypothetical protein